MTQKRAFDIDRFVAAIEANYRQWNPPIITFIANRGATPFEVLVSTLLSLRTKDEVTGEAARRLLDAARTPETMATLSPKKIEDLIYPVGFYPTKAKRLRSISRILLERYDGKVPDTLEALTALPGVGRKTANLVLVEGFKIPAIGKCLPQVARDQLNGLFRQCVCDGIGIRAHVRLQRMAQRIDPGPRSQVGWQPYGQPRVEDRRHRKDRGARNPLFQCIRVMVCPSTSTRAVPLLPACPPDRKQGSG
jgi:hypothetical protein